VIKNLIESFYVFEAWGGISADEEAEWKRYGFTKLSDVLKGYFDPKDVAEWRNAGLRDGKEAREWYKAKEWISLGVSKTTATALEKRRNDTRNV
jgi:hypothetical protein